MNYRYYENPPGLQLLHCLKNSVKGGASYFTDSFKAVDILRKSHPEDYEVLSTIPLTYHYINDNHYMHFNRPVITYDKYNDTMVTNYSPPFQGPAEIEDVETEEKVYKAFRKFTEYVEDPKLRFEYLLKPGDLVIFANRRVLHARHAFDASSGDRHLKGAYIDMCEFKDKFRVLKKIYQG